MKKLLKQIGVSTAVMGLAVTPVGLASADSSIGTTGPDSTNKIQLRHDARYKVTNNNNLTASNNNPQSSHTGDARVNDNTEGGNAESGEAMNDGFLSVTANVDNSGSSEAALGAAEAAGTALANIDASIDTTGPDSYNKIEVRNNTRVNIENNNNVNISNNNSQTATSGDAKVYHNTSGGDAMSGDASNVSTTTIDLSVTN